MQLLEGKVCLVTGAAAGIGAGIVHLYVSEGAIVYAIDVNESQGATHAFRADVRRPDQLEPVVLHALEQYGRIDVLVNNAGIYPRKAFIDMTEAEWDEVLDVNLKGVFHCTKLVLPHMLKPGAGKIVNISSIHVFRAGATLSHYTASKSGVVGFSGSLSREVGASGVYVNCITPGAIQTEGEKLIAKPGEIEALVAQQSIQRRLQPLDVARVCLFLSCELSDGITGQTINVDGGRILH
jgi:3-oxoacyl-[acyl-carrier protein] reductase